MGSVTNGTDANDRTRVPEAGVYCPAITFFDPETDTLLPEIQKQYYQYLASSGLKGLVILGTNAETLLLTRTERATLLKLAREAVGPSYPIIAGVSAHSTAQVKEHISDAVEAGANYVLVLPCAYFGKQTTPSVINRFFSDIASFSPLPIILYNFPAVCNGIDLQSDTITELANAHSNIVGVKLTCGSVGKISRLSGTFPRSRFAIFGGQSDFLVGGLASGSAGCIAAFANIFPRTCVKIFDHYKHGRHEDALRLQQVAATAEGFCKSGIASTKYGVSQHSARLANISGAKWSLEEMLRPRRPYEEPDEKVKAKIREGLEEVGHIEEMLRMSSRS